MTPPRRPRFFAALVFAAAAMLAGCAYKSEVRQGSPLDETKLAQLQTGMNKQQVRELLGPPQSDRLFRDNIWLYYHKKRSAGFFPHTTAISVEVVFGDDGRVESVKRLIDEREEEK